MVNYYLKGTFRAESKSHKYMQFYVLNEAELDSILRRMAVYCFGLVDV